MVDAEVVAQELRAGGRDSGARRSVSTAGQQSNPLQQATPQILCVQRHVLRATPAAVDAAHDAAGDCTAEVLAAARRISKKIKQNRMYVTFY